MSDKEKTREELKKISKGKGGSWIYGIILMLGGVLLLALGILDLLGYSWIYNYLISIALNDLAAALPVAGIMNFVIGLFAVISGYGLIIDQEWAWGIAMLILVYSAVQAVIYIIQNYLSLLLSPSILIDQAMFWVSISVLIVAITGLIYLGLTKYKYE